MDILSASAYRTSRSLSFNLNWSRASVAPRRERRRLPPEEIELKLSGTLAKPGRWDKKATTRRDI